MSEPSHESSIFNAARKIERGADRDDYVTEACGGDSALQERVKKLLSAYDAESQFLEQSAAELDPTIVPDTAGSNRANSLQAGLAAAFHEDQSVVLGSAGHSVLKSLGDTIEKVPHVMLRDGDGDDPITRPSSPEIPDRDADSRYRLDGEIARGGMGAILKGRDTDLGRDLAIKVLLDSHKDKPEVIQRFVEEAQIGGQLQHPGIAPVYELGQFNDQRPFFSMKLVKGQTLAKLLADRKEPAEDRSRFIAIFEQVCQTMAYAHSRGVIHRDLKPANIMVGAFGEVQVMDWGLAKVLPAGGVADEKKSRMKSEGQSIIQTLRSGVGSDAPAVGSVGSAGSHTQVGSVMGTPAYMPPEQALGEIDVMDERADVFGLGAILCEILTGKPPYVGDDGTQIFRLASRGKLTDCFERLDACGADEDLIALTKLCLELEPDDRPGNAGVLAERVTEYLESVESRLRQAEMERAAQAARADAEAARVEAERQHAQAESRRAEAECQRAEAERLRLVQQQHATRKLKRALMGLAVVALLALVASVVAVRAKRYADLANLEAQRQADAAERSAVEEMKSAERARKSADDAKLAAKLAAANEAEAVAAQQALQQKKFSADMTLTQHTYEAGNTDAISRRLLQYVPIDDEPDRRGVEWRLWWNASHQEQRVIPTPEGGQAFAIAISPDGKLAADSHQKAYVRLRETANPEKIKTFFVYGVGAIHWLAFSPDSSMLATVGEQNNRIDRFSAEDGSSLGSVRAPVPLRDLSFSPTANQLVSGGDDGRLYFWDTLSWDRRDTPVSDDSLPIWSVAYSPDGSRIVAGTDGAGAAEYSVLGFDSPLVLFDTASRSIRSMGRGHTARITSVAWSPDGQLIASGSADATVQVWTKDLSPVGTLDSGSWVTRVAFSPDGKYLAAGTDMDNAIRVWKTDDWEPATTLKGHSKSVTSIAFDPRRGDLWSVSQDAAIKTWSIEPSLHMPGVVLDDEPLRTMLGNAYRISASGDGRTLFCCKLDGAIERYDLGNRTALPAWKERTLYKQAAFSDDGRIMATADESTELIQVWRVDNEELIAQVPTKPKEISSLRTLCVSRDAKRIGWTAGDSPHLHLVLFDTEGGHRRQVPFRLQKNGLIDWTAMSISGDAKRLYVKIGYDFRVMEIDDFVKGVEAEPTDIEAEGILLAHSFAFSDDGWLGAAPDFSSRISLLNLNKGQASHTLAGHSGEALCADFTNDSRRLLSGSKDGTVKIWDVTTGDSLATLRGHAGPVDWVGFRNDDSQIISVSRADGTVRIWNAATEEKIWQKPVTWVELARHHQRANRLANAIAAYDRAVELAPDDPELRSSRIELNGRMGRFAAAMADYLWLIAKGKASAEDVTKARALPHSPLVAGASEQPLEHLIDLLTTALDEDPNNVHLLQTRAQAYRERGDDQLAAADEAKLLSRLRPLVKTEWESPDVAWPVYAPLLADPLLESFQPGKLGAWQVLETSEMKSAGGATLTRLPDGSILASGPNPDSDTYTIVAETDLTDVAALRIEALPHASLPRGGPGRDSTRDLGNFAITGMRIESASRAQHDETSPIEFGEAWADWDNGAAPDSLLRGHWNTGGRGGVPHQAIYQLKQPIRNEQGVRLLFNIRFQTSPKYPGQNLGRFRLSVASDPDLREKTMFASMSQTLRSDWARLAAAYQLTGDADALEQLLDHKPRVIAELGDQYLVAERWEEAIRWLSRLISPDTPDARPLILRGEAYAALGQWDEANEDWCRGAELDESVLRWSFDRLRQAGKWQAAAKLGMIYVEQEPGDYGRWLNVAPLLVMAEDEQGYRQFCDAMVKQFSGTSNRTHAASTCKACLLLPDAVDLSKLPVKVFADSLDAGTTGEWLRPWAWAARALVAYRNGDLELASKYLQQGWANEPGESARALYHAIAALVRQGRGDSDGAHEALGHVRRMLDQHLPKAKARRLHDWLIPQILADEAERLLNNEGESSEAERTNGSD
jgi:WD40 repeat protein/serine/threonine protein kinase